jgi:hypothetical protein
MSLNLDSLYNAIREYLHGLAMADHSVSLVTMQAALKQDYRDYWWRHYHGNLYDQQSLPDLYNLEERMQLPVKPVKKRPDSPVTSLPEPLCCALDALYKNVARYFSPAALNFFLVGDVSLMHGLLSVAVQLGRGPHWVTMPPTHTRQHWYATVQQPSITGMVCPQRLLYDETVSPRVS